jgi:hypothetical protein
MPSKILFSVSQAAQPQPPHRHHPHTLAGRWAPASIAGPQLRTPADTRRDAAAHQRQGGGGPRAQGRREGREGREGQGRGGGLLLGWPGRGVQEQGGGQARGAGEVAAGGCGQEAGGQAPGRARGAGARQAQDQEGRPRGREQGAGGARAGAIGRRRHAITPGVRDAHATTRGSSASRQPPCIRAHRHARTRRR